MGLPIRDCGFELLSDPPFSQVSASLIPPQQTFIYGGARCSHSDISQTDAIVNERDWLVSRRLCGNLIILIQHTNTHRLQKGSNG